VKTCSCASWAYFSLSALTCSAVGETRGEVSGVETIWSFSRVEVTTEVILSIVVKSQGEDERVFKSIGEEKEIENWTPFCYVFVRGQCVCDDLFPYFVFGSLFCCEFGQGQANDESLN
jgi:hypothetical protein